MSARRDRALGLAAAALAIMAEGAAATNVPLDPANPTCPRDPDWAIGQEMHFTVQETANGPVLVAEGWIDDDLVPRLRAEIDANPDIGEIRLRSPGGSATAGNAAGLLIRASGMETRIPAGATCHGACAFMFMGGILRTVDEDGVFMVNTRPPFAVLDETGMPIDRRRIDEIAQVSRLQATADHDYLIRMGIDRALLTEIIYQPPVDGSSHRCLTAAELARYNIVPRTLAGSSPAAGSGKD